MVNSRRDSNAATTNVVVGNFKYLLLHKHTIAALLYLFGFEHFLFKMIKNDRSETASQVLFYIINPIFISFFQFFLNLVFRCPKSILNKMKICFLNPLRMETMIYKKAAKLNEYGSGLT